MSIANNNLSWQDRLGYEFRRNKSKSLMLAILLVVAVVMVVKLVFKRSPQAAQGQSLALAVPAVPAGPAPTPAQKRVEQPAGANTTGAGGSRSGSPEPRTIKAAKVEFLRDVFRPDPAVFTTREEVEAASPDEARTQVRLEANTLRLTSTMVGEISCVTINGQLLRINDWVEGFQVLSIAKGSCVVAKKGVRVQLDMES